MSDTPLRARSVTEIVDALFQLYRRHALQLMVVAAVAYAPWVVLQLTVFGGGIFDMSRTTAATPTLAFGLGTALNVLGTIILFSAMTGVITRMASQAYLYGAPGDLGNAFREVLPKAVHIIIGAFLRGLVMLVLFFPFILVSIHPVFAIVAFLALCVGGPYLYARYLVVTPVIVLEDRGAIEAMSRAAVLSRGRKLHAIGAYALLMLIYLVLMFGISMVMAVVRLQMVAVLLNSLFVLVSFPIFSLTEMLLYYDMRIRNEGYDLEMMAASLDAPQVTAH
jgi:hypothetical protein